MLSWVFCKNVRSILAVPMILGSKCHNWYLTTLSSFESSRIIDQFLDPENFLSFCKPHSIFHQEPSAFLSIFEHYALKNIVILVLE